MSPDQATPAAFRVRAVVHAVAQMLGAGIEPCTSIQGETRGSHFVRQQEDFHIVLHLKIPDGSTGLQSTSDPSSSSKQPC